MSYSSHPIQHPQFPGRNASSVGLRMIVGTKQNEIGVAIVVVLLIYVMYLEHRQIANTTPLASVSCTRSDL